jgi:hypothetical protein
VNPLPRLALRQGDHPHPDLYAKKHGFESRHIEGPAPGNEQQSQWLSIRRIKPDWVIPASAGA